MADIFITSASKDELIRELRVVWQTDAMVRTLTVRSLGAPAATRLLMSFSSRYPSPWTNAKPEARKWREVASPLPSSGRQMSSCEPSGCLAWTSMTARSREKRIEYRGYYFFIPSKWEQFPRKSPMPTGKFSTNPEKHVKYPFLSITVLDPCTVMEKAHSGFPSPKDYVDDSLRHLHVRPPPLP